MARKKKLGHGIQVSINATAYGLVRKFKPNKVSRTMVDVTCFDDELEMSLDSDPPNYGEIEFEAAWDPEDAEEAAIDNVIQNDDINDREVTIAFKVRKVGTGTPPAASTWTYTTYTYTGRIEEVDPVEIDSKTMFARRVKVRLTAKPVKS